MSARIAHSLLLKERARFLGRHPTNAPTARHFSSVPRGKSLAAFFFFAERACTVRGSAPIAHSLCRRTCTVLGSAPKPLTAFAEERARFSGRHPNRSQPLPKSVQGSWVGAPTAHSLCRKSVHGTRVGAHRSQPSPKSVRGTRVGAHRSQPLPKSVHGTRVGAHPSQPLPKSVHGIRVGAHRSQPLPKSVSLPMHQSCASRIL